MSSLDTEAFCPASLEEWREWLKRHHKKKPSVWLVQYKKGSSKPCLTWSDAVDEALCFGWIDSIRQPIDEERYRQFFSPRKPKSVWSKINKEKVERLTAEGRMTKAGLDSIHIAKENGSWTQLDEVEALIIPADLHEALNKRDGASEFFLSRSKSIKKRMLSWLILAKRPETRAKRIDEIAIHAANEKTPPNLP